MKINGDGNTSGEIDQQIVAGLKNRTETCVDMGHLRRQDRTDKSTFRTGADHFPIDEAIIRRHRFALFFCCGLLPILPVFRHGTQGVRIR